MPIQDGQGRTRPSRPRQSAAGPIIREIAERDAIARLLAKGSGHGKVDDFTEKFWRNGHVPTIFTANGRGSNDAAIKCTHTG